MSADRSKPQHASSQSTPFSESASTSNSSSSSRQRFSCPICYKMFTRKDNLKVHQRVHTGDMPFECKYCGLPFRWTGALHTHEANHAKKGHPVGTTTPATRKRRKSEARSTSSPRTNIPATSQDRANNEDRARDRRHKEKGEAGRREHDTRRETSTRASSSVVISEEDVTLDMLSREPWRDVFE